MRSLSSIREILFPINRFVSSLISTIIEKSKAFLRVGKNKKKILDLHFRLRSENRVKKNLLLPESKEKYMYISRGKGREKKKKKK